MQIQLKEKEIIIALKRYVSARGIQIAGKDVTVSFLAGRKQSGLSADIYIPDDEDFDENFDVPVVDELFPLPEAPSDAVPEPAPEATPEAGALTPVRKLADGAKAACRSVIGNTIDPVAAALNKTMTRTPAQEKETVSEVAEVAEVAEAPAPGKRTIAQAVSANALDATEAPKAEQAKDAKDAKDTDDITGAEDLKEAQPPVPATRAISQAKAAKTLFS